MGLLSLVTLVTLSNEPIAVEMNPLGTFAEMSSVLPMTRGLGPCGGVIGMFGAGAHRAPRHVTRG